VPPGINCGAACSVPYLDGTTVTLIATPGSLAAFGGWSGCDGISGANCTVTLTSARTVSVTFVPEFALKITTSGNGSVTSSPGGLASCGAGCSIYLDGTLVTLTAVPGFGQQLQAWSGACFGNTSCAPLMTANQSVTATFSPLPSFGLTVNVTGSGHGTTD